VGIDVGQRSVWALSIDDLRVYSELFDNALTFLHFVEQRLRASQSAYVDLNDEMDHLGLYVAQNNYSQYAAELMANGLGRINFNGYTTAIDEYYGALVRGDTPKLVRQETPLRLAEIVNFLNRSKEPLRAELVSFLLDGGGEFRDSLAAGIEQALRENRELRRARPLSFYGPMAMTLWISSPSAPRTNGQALDHARAVMMADGEASRRLVELEYATDDTLVGAHLNHVSLLDVSMAEMERIKQAGENLKHRRVQQAQAKGKIGRNDACPCGSGRKFKKCHGRT
jgi:preprotein translocase subunit SecA